MNVDGQTSFEKQDVTEVEFTKMDPKGCHSDQGPSSRAAGENPRLCCRFVRGLTVQALCCYCTLQHARFRIH